MCQFYQISPRIITSDMKTMMKDGFDTRSLERLAERIP